jgi:hypothetical protein
LQSKNQQSHSLKLCIGEFILTMSFSLVGFVVMQSQLCPIHRQHRTIHREHTRGAVPEIVDVQCGSACFFGYTGRLPIEAAHMSLATNHTGCASRPAARRGEASVNGLGSLDLASSCGQRAPACGGESLHPCSLQRIGITELIVELIACVAAQSATRPCHE